MLRTDSNQFLEKSKRKRASKGYRLMREAGDNPGEQSPGSPGGVCYIQWASGRTVNPERAGAASALFWLISLDLAHYLIL